MTKSPQTRTMSNLVVYYSRTGNTEQVGQEIASQLNADIEKIKEKKEWKGKFGILCASLAALFKRESEITTNKNPKDYDLIIIGTPVWAGHIPPAVRHYLTGNTFNQVACFCTFRNHEGSVLSDMEGVTKEPVATLTVKEEGLPAEEQIKEFCNELR